MLFALWLVVGTAYVVAVLGILTIGILVLPVAIIANAFAARRRPLTPAVFGLLGGLGIPLLFVGFANINGPGNVCTHFAGGESCTQEWTPWPWLLAGAVLIVVAIVLFVRSPASPRTRHGAAHHP
jgi:hypothetical protein